MYIAQKSQNMASGSPAVDAKLVLERNDLDVVDVEEIGRTAVGI